MNSFSEVTGQPSGQVFYGVSHHRQDVGASFPGAVATSPWEKSVQLELGEFMKTKCVLAEEYVALGGRRNWERPHSLKLLSTNPSRYSRKIVGK